MLYFFFLVDFSKTHYRSTRKHAIEKRRVVPGNNSHLSKTFPTDHLRNINKISMN